MYVVDVTPHSIVLKINSIQAAAGPVLMMRLTGPLVMFRILMEDELK